VARYGLEVSYARDPDQEVSRSWDHDTSHVRMGWHHQWCHPLSPRRHQSWHNFGYFRLNLKNFSLVPQQTPRTMEQNTYHCIFAYNIFIINQVAKMAGIWHEKLHWRHCQLPDACAMLKINKFAVEMPSFKVSWPAKPKLWLMKIWF